MVAQSVFSTGLLTSYCSAEDALALLVGYDLSGLGDEEAQAARLAALLPLTRRAVDAAAGRDFLWHPGEVVILDGSGTDRLNLLPAGITPLAAVHEVAVDGQPLPAAAWVAYLEAAQIRLLPAAPRQGRFAAGRQNVAVTLDWGYPQPPGEVALAQAKLTAAQLLSEAAGESAGAAAVRLGDYAVHYRPGGRYSSAVADLVNEAQALLRPYRTPRLRSV